MGGFLAFVGFVAIIAGVVGTVKGKIGVLRIASRKSASVVIAGGLILLMAGASMAGGGSAPSTDQPLPQITTPPSTSRVVVESPSPTPPPSPSPSPSPSQSPQPVYSPAQSSTSESSYNDTGSCGEDYYRNSDGACVHRPVSSDTAPPGATAQCRDGTYSFSQHRSGTCSGHGGVERWL